MEADFWKLKANFEKFGSWKQTFGSWKLIFKKVGKFEVKSGFKKNLDNFKPKSKSESDLGNTWKLEDDFEKL